MRYNAMNVAVRLTKQYRFLKSFTGLISQINSVRSTRPGRLEQVWLPETRIRCFHAFTAALGDIYTMLAGRVTTRPGRATYTARVVEGGTEARKGLPVTRVGAVPPHVTYNLSITYQ